MEPNEKADDITDSGTPEAETPAAAGTTARLELLRAGDVRAQTGITHQVLYRYHTLGLVEATATTPSGQRLYHPSVVPLIRAIQLLTKSGYSLRSLKEIFFKKERVLRATSPDEPPRD